MANYYLPPLNERKLRIDLETPRTVFRWYEEYCATKILGICVNRAYTEHLEYDFNFDIKADRIKMNDMGFVCQVRDQK